MATSGSKSVTVTSYDTLKFSWTAGNPSIANNTTTVSWKMELIAGAYGRISSSASKAWSVTVDGKDYSGTTTVGISNNSTKTLASGSTVIKHNSDGSKTFSYSFSQDFSGITFSGTALGKKSGSGSGTLDTIPRQATITAAPNFDDEDNPTITYSNPAGNSVTSLQACIGWSGADDIAYRDVSKTGTSYTFSLTTAERNKIRNACTTANSMSLKFYLKTVIGGETYYSRATKTVTIVNAEPTISPTAVEDTDASTDGGDAAGNISATGSNTRWLKGISDVRYAFNASAKKGATIKSYSVVCGSKKGTSASGVLFNVDSGSIKFVVTDSRGNTVTQTLTRTLVNYVKPTCNLSAKIALDTGTTAQATLNIKGNCFNGEIKAGVKNTIKVWYRYKEENGSYGSWVQVTPTLSGNTYSINYVVPDSLNYQNNYTFQARMQDDLELAYGDYVTSGTQTVNAKPVFDWGKSDFNFNVPVTVHNGDVGFTHVHSTSGNGISFGVGSGGINRGVWDKQYSKWLMYTNDTNTYIADANNTYTIGKNKVLWSGKYYMTAGQTVNLSEAISKQMTGIILVFSRYDVSTAEAMNEHFSYHFVPKEIVALHNGKGSYFELSTSNGSYSAGKYLYISDGSIKGHDNNGTTGITGTNGIKYDNNRFVLRYVIGV